MPHANAAAAKEYFKAHNAKRREAQRAYMREYYKKRRDELKARAHAAYHENPEAVQRRRRELRTEEQRAAASAYRKQHYAQNRAYYLEGARRRKLTNKQATPRWANLGAIRALYAEARRLSGETGTPHHVDHIVPVNSSLVCGLHTEANLQVVPAAENLKKSNRWAIE